jgi:hypothetical protein
VVINKVVPLTLPLGFIMNNDHISPLPRDQLLKNGLQLRAALQEAIKYKENHYIHLEQVCTLAAYFVNEVEMFLESQKAQR